jgi:hypothetical protein
MVSVKYYHAFEMLLAAGWLLQHLSQCVVLGMGMNSQRMQCCTWGLVMSAWR